MRFSLSFRMPARVIVAGEHARRCGNYNSVLTYDDA
jgi:hypothetical protein